MRLRDLNAEFLGGYSEITDGKAQVSYHRVDSLDGAQGIIFQCPKCAARKPIKEEDGRRFVCGAHSIICWFLNPKNTVQVPDHANPKPGRWIASGTGIDDLTFIGPNAASVLLTGGCNWHGFVKNGDAS